MSIGKLKKLIDKEFGKDAYICIYNKRNQFLCEGIVSALRKNPLWQLLDEENANVASMFSGISENGKKSSNYQIKSISREVVKMEKYSTCELKRAWKALYKTTANTHWNDIELWRDINIELAKRLERIGRNEYRKFVESSR